MAHDYDAIVVGSGAGGGMTAWKLSQAGYSVLVLEKGSWFKEADFNKDEIACCRRSVYTPNLKEEQHVIEEKFEDGWQATPTSESGWDFWNGNCVGGASNFMSGFFYRMKPVDFKLLSEFGSIKGANIVDWPISYQDLEPYYAAVEKIVGISGRVVNHPFQEPRSTSNFPYPPTAEHPIAQWIDRASEQKGLNAIPIPRAILPYSDKGRSGCSYSGYCGSYGCSTGAKGSSRAALLDDAVKTGNCTIKADSKVYKIESDNSGKISAVLYYNKLGLPRRANAKIYVVACQPIESSRLLLQSTGPKYPNGLGNNNGQLGKNLIFSAGATGSSRFRFKDFSEKQVAELKIQGLFENRGLQDWYVFNHPKLGKIKGGTIDLLFRHSNPISRAHRRKWSDGVLNWGSSLKKALKDEFTSGKDLKFEIFCDWSPVDNCYVKLDPKVKDKWGSPVAKVRLDSHPHDLKVGRYLADRTEDFLKHMGAKSIESNVSAEPPANLVAGGCRFGINPETSVLDPDCRSHFVENLFVTDSSFMPTGGSVTYTWTIYANALRVAEKIIKQM